MELQQQISVRHTEPLSAARADGNGAVPESVGRISAELEQQMSVRHTEVLSAAKADGNSSVPEVSGRHLRNSK